MLKKLSLCLALSLSLGFSAVNYPYPQARAYGNSTINVTSSGASTTLKTRFTDFVTNFYETGSCGNATCARIKFDDNSKTVSEGIAYGMLMMVYFSDATTSYQTHFDRLWAYYQHWKNENGLMSWKIDGFSKVSDPTADNKGAASDAEFDAAVALIMAHYQFGSTSTKNYLDTAKALIGKIRTLEIDPNNLHKPGDVWDDAKNPSYIAPAAFAMFQEVECHTNKTKWGNVVTANYNLLKANQNSTSGLFSDWCNSSGTAVQGKADAIEYGYDAARVPWRLAWANAWYGHTDAKTLLTNVTSKYLSGKSPGDIGGAIALTGSSSKNQKNSTFVGPFMNAFSYASSNQTTMNNYWTTLMNFSGESYYNRALNILTGLLATGNMPNLQALAGGLPADYCNATVSGSQIDQFAKAGLSADDRSYASTWEPWYAFTDKEDGGASTITGVATTTKTVWDKKTKTCVVRNDNYNVVVQDGSDWVAKINYTLSQGSNEWHPYVAIGLDAQNNGQPGFYNFSGCTGGFSYQYKGSAHNFKAQLSTVEDYGYHFYAVGSKNTPVSAWTTVVVTPNDLQQEAWPVKVTFDLSKIAEFSWELKGDGTNDGKAITGVSPMTGSLAIKDFKCIGTMTFPAEKRLKCEEGGSTPSSSSKASSSSVSSGQSSSSARSSSSVASSSSLSSSSSRSSSSAGNSSSSGGTPILLSQIVNSNALITMQNAVNIQATNNVAVQIFDLKGNAVRSLRFAQGSYIVQLADLPKGLYIVKANSSSWSKTVKLAIN